MFRRRQIEVARRQVVCLADNHFRSFAMLRLPTLHASRAARLPLSRALSARFASSHHKVFADADAAVRDIPSGAKLIVGGFGLCGIPESSIHALVKQVRLVLNPGGSCEFRDNT